MSDDLKRNVEAEREALKAEDRKKAEFAQPREDGEGNLIKRAVATAQEKLKARRKVLKAFKGG